jgi:hypothetical protein
MELGNIAIFKDLESIYPSLYDLFNLNFTRIDGKNYARIAKSNYNTIPCYVHDNFNCVILINKNNLLNQDAPFLNRFEKYEISFKEILIDEYLKIGKEIYEMFKFILNKKEINFFSQLINFNLDEILALIYKITKNEKKEKYEIVEDILKKIVPLFSKDIISFIYYQKKFVDKNLFENYPNLFDTMIKIYNRKEHYNIKNYLETIEKKKNIIYTFSHIYEPILSEDENDDLNEIQTKFGNINKKSIEHVLINEIESERNIEERIEYFYNNNDKNCYIIHFNMDQIKHLYHIKYLIENLERKKYKNINKIFILLIHLKREDFSDFSFISNVYDDYNQIFIDSLNGLNISIIDILNKNNK